MVFYFRPVCEASCAGGDEIVSRLNHSLPNLLYNAFSIEAMLADMHTAEHIVIEDHRDYLLFLLDDTRTRVI